MPGWIDKKASRPVTFPKSFDVSRVSGTFCNSKPGPKTPQGKAVAARNATTHGLFARDIVLPSLGEDAAGYDALHFALCEQINPRNLLEQHYVEAIAAASWRLRRLHRWQAQIYEDETLTQDECLTRLDRVLRHETTLHRQIDKAVRLLGRDVPFLFEGRARKEALAKLGQTERSCRADSTVDQDVADHAHDNLQFQPLPSDFERKRLDTLRPDTEADISAKTEKCQNEPAARDEKETEDAAAEEAAPDTVRSPKTAEKVRQLTQAGSKKMSSTLPLLSSVLLPLKKMRLSLNTARSNAHSNAREGGELNLQSTGVQPRVILP